jgi:hypothetical protein
MKGPTLKEALGLLTFLCLLGVGTIVGGLFGVIWVLKYFGII